MDDWIPGVLICPDCFRFLNADFLYFHVDDDRYSCPFCKKKYFKKNNIISFPNPPDSRRQWLFEMKRYEGIALAPKGDYVGYGESYPLERAGFLKTLLMKKELILNTGPGFGYLEKELCNKTRIVYSLDMCKAFLEYVQKQNYSNNRLIHTFAERTPFQSNYFDAVVSDSVFQTVIDQREFLTEQARVLKRDGLFILTVTYKWNYPRKPQEFPVSRPHLLESFLAELGISGHVEYRQLPSLNWAEEDNAEMLVYLGSKYEKTPY